jgi:6-phosphogluconolactonase (cycloisomerase 2 family)
MTMKVRALQIAVVLVGTSWLAGCGHYVCSTTFGASSCTPSGGGISQGPGNGSNGQTAFIYFIDNNATQGGFPGQMAAEGANVSNSGTFAPISSFASPTFTGATGVGSGMVVVNKKYLYIPFTGGLLFGYSIDPGSGALTGLLNSPYTISGGTSIVADPKGRFLFVGDSSGISTFIVNADGSLGANSQSPFSTGGITPVTMTTDGTGKFLYIADGGGVIAYAYDQVAGSLSPLGGSLAAATFNFPMIQVVGESTGKYLVGITAASGATDNTVHVFSIAQTGTAGALTEVANSPFTTTYAPVFVVTSPSGDFVYTFNETTSQIGTTIAPMEGFTLDTTTGALVELPTISPFPNLLGQVGAFDQSGTYLFLIGEEPNSTITGTTALSFSSSNGALGANFPYAGAPSFIFAVTDEP